jgi:hypothetical protein
MLVSVLKILLDVFTVTKVSSEFLGVLEKRRCLESLGDIKLSEPKVELV